MNIQNMTTLSDNPEGDHTSRRVMSIISQNQQFCVIRGVVPAKQ